MAGNARIGRPSRRGGSARAVVTAITLAALWAPAAANGDTIEVDSAADAGGAGCELREAIDAANSGGALANGCDPGSPGADLIVFDGLAAPVLIQPTSQLPDITDGTTIDATTIDGSADGTCSGAPGLPEVALDGSLAGVNSVGLKLAGGGGSSICRLQIVNFSNAGVRIQSPDNILQANLIGSDGTSEMGNSFGVVIAVAADNQIGVATPNGGNLISGNDLSGILMSNGASGNVVAGNVIGTDINGSAAIPNGADSNDAGVRIESGSHDNQIGGTSAAHRNLISGNTSSIGVRITDAGSDANEVLGNWIGINDDGDGALANSRGVLLISGASENQIGSAQTGAGNVISGNAIAGVEVFSSDNELNQIQGNRIGTNPAGTAAIPNGQQGVRMKDGDSTLVGGTEPGAGNLISGNTLGGISVTEADSTRIQGNLIGVNAGGTAPLANGQTGITVSWTASPGAVGTEIGSAEQGAGNLISGNAISGVFISNIVSGISVRGNFIGTDTTGTAAIPNNLGGGSGAVSVAGNIALGFPAGVAIGGPAPSEGNLISGNAASGVHVAYSGVNPSPGTDVSIEGNRIGSGEDGVGALPNAVAGVDMRNTRNMLVKANTIAHNGADGVSVIDFGDPTTGNSILGNSIHSNGNGIGDIGIDLANNGLTQNDPGDPDLGPNSLQNFPELSGAQANSVDTTVQGTLDSDGPGDTYRVELFSNAICDLSGNGEGRTFLGTTEQVADGTGDLSFDAVVAPAGTTELITATATNLTTGDTSEFSACHAVVAKAEPPDPPAPPDPGGGGGGGEGDGATNPPVTPDTEVAVSLDAKRTQKVRRATLTASCGAEACELAVSGVAIVPNLKGKSAVAKRQRFRLKPKQASVGAGQTTTVKLKFKGGKRRVAKLGDLLRSKKVRRGSKLIVTVTATDASGNAETEKLRLKLKR